MSERSFTVEVGEAGGAPLLGAERAELYALEVRSDEEARDSEASGTPAILLHGGPGASHDYLRPQLDALGSPTRPLFYYDQRGSGRSTLPTTWPAGGIHQHLADLHAVIDATATAPPILIGYSWGGLLALHFALEAPRAITKLLLISPAPPNIEAREVMRTRLAAAAERPDVRAFGERIDRSDKRQRFAALIAGFFVEPRRALEVTPFVVRTRAELGIWESLRGYDLRPRLSSLAVETLIIHGSDDPVPVESSRETAELSGARLIELPRCGHVPYVEASGPFLAAARAFLDS